jgi:taurine transport system permease protein
MGSKLITNLLHYFGITSKKDISRKKTVKFGDPSEIGKGRIYSVLSGIIILLSWFLVSEFEVVPPLFWASPTDVFEVFWEVSTEGYRGHTLGGHILISLYRVLSGWILGCLIGIPIGIGMGLSSFVKGAMDPIIELYRPVPPLAYISLIIIWMGIGDKGKIFLLFLATFSIFVINSRSGVRSVTIERIHAAYSLGASRYQILFHVILINALPEIFTGMRVAMGVAWGTLVAAEMVAATSGIGWMVINAARFLRTDLVLMGIIVMALLGYGFDFLLRTSEKAVIPWKGKE